MKALKVLHIEDNIGIRGAFRRMLREHQVVPAENYDTAIKVLLSGEHFDVIISDYDLGGGNTGGDVLSWLRLNQPEMVKRFMFASANPNIEDIHPMYVYKPCDSKQVFQVINQMMGASC